MSYYPLLRATIAIMDKLNRINVYLTPELAARVAKAQRELARQSPGVEVSMTGAIRHLLLIGLDAMDRRKDAD